MSRLSRILLIVALHLLAFGVVMGALLVRQPWQFGAIVLGGGLGAIGARNLLRSRYKLELGELFDSEQRVSQLALLCCVVAFPVFMTLVFKQIYWIYVATLAGLYVCLALGLNIVVGLAGLLDLGYIGFYAIGAYLSALVSLKIGAWWALWLMIPVVMTVTALCGMTLGAPTLRLKGDYLAIVTLGFGEIIRIILNNWNSVTNGPIGLPNIPYPRIGGFDFQKGVYVLGVQFTQETLFYTLIVTLVYLIASAARRIDDSRVGRAWRAIREDELAAGAMGINTRNLRLMAFATGASIAGVSGLVFAHMNTFIEPNSFAFMESAFILCMVVLGGMGSIPGVILGAILLAVLPEKFRDFQEYRMLVLGASMVLMMNLRPQGLIPRRHRPSSIA